MKTLIAIGLIMCSPLIYSQKIIEDKIDDFTQKRIVKTDWEKIVATSSLYLNIQLSKVNETKYMDLKFFTNKVTSIDTKDDISFMLENNEIVNLKSNSYKISGYGDGSIGLKGSAGLGLHIECLLSDADVEKFKGHLITKIRINTSTGYFQDEVKPKKSEVFKKTFELIF